MPINRWFLVNMCMQGGHVACMHDSVSYPDLIIVRYNYCDVAIKVSSVGLAAGVATEQRSGKNWRCQLRTVCMHGAV